MTIKRANLKRDSPTDTAEWLVWNDGVYLKSVLQLDFGYVEWTKDGIVPCYKEEDRWCRTLA